MTFGLILATVRRIVANDRHVRSKLWPQASAVLTEKVWGERLGIIGLGRIGMAVARRAEAFGMQIAYHGRHQQPDANYRYYSKASELARNVKILVVAIPGNKARPPVVDREVIDALGAQGYLVNISRGWNIDEPYLVDALANGRLAGAGLDVFAGEPYVPEALFALDNVVLSPHAASGTQATRDALGQCAVDNLAAFFAGRPLLSPIPATPGN
jgi:lactate dehydrogenase-like 2-hydroxyacid dehydrogenase